MTAVDLRTPAVKGIPPLELLSEYESSSVSSVVTFALDQHLRSEMDDLRRDRDSLQRLVMQLRLEHAEQLATMRADHASALIEHERQVARAVGELKSEAQQRLGDSTQVLREALEKSRLERDDLQRKLDVAQHRINTLSTENQQQVAQMLHLSRSVPQESTEPGVLHTGIDETSAALESARKLQEESQEEARAARQAYEGLKHRVGMLEEDKSFLSKDNDDLRSKMASFQSEMKRILAENVHLKDVHARFTDESALQRERETAKWTEAHETEVRRLRDAMQSEGDRLKFELRELYSTELINTRAKLSERDAELKEARADLRVAHDEISTLRSQLARIESASESRASGLLSELGAKTIALEREALLRADIVSERDELRARVTAAEEKCDILRGEISRMEREFLEVHGAHQQERLKLQHELDKFVGLKSQLAAASSAAASSDRPGEVIGAELVRAQRRIGQLENVVQLKEESIVKLSQEIDSMKASIAVADGPQHGIIELYAQKDQELSVALRKNADLTDTLHDTERELVRAKADLQRLLATRGAFKRIVEQLPLENHDQLMRQIAALEGGNLSPRKPRWVGKLK